MLKIHWSDFHFCSLNGANATPFHGSIIPSDRIDTIQVALCTVIEPPGSSYYIDCGAICCGYVIILIFCREFTAIMFSQKISSSA